MEEKFRRIVKYLTDIKTCDLCLIGFYMTVLLVYVIPFNRKWDVWFHWIWIIWTLALMVWHVIRKKWVKEPVGIVLYLLFGVCALSYVIQPKGHGIIELKTLINLLMMIIVFFLSSWRAERIQWKKVFDAICLLAVGAVFVMNVVSLFVYFGRSIPGMGFLEPVYTGMLSLPRDYVRPRFFGMHSYPTLAGFNCCTTMILSGYLYDQKRIKLPVLAAHWILCIIMTVLGDARTAYIQIGVILLYVIHRILVQKLERRTVNRMEFAVLVLALIAGVISQWNLITTVFSGNFQLSQFNQFSSNRLTLWSIAFSEFLKRPFTGWGFLNNDCVQLYTLGEYDGTHNILISLLLWTGIPGALLFTVFVVMLVVKVVKQGPVIQKEKTGWLVVLLVCALIQANLDIMIIGEFFRITTPFFWLIAGYFMSAVRETGRVLRK